MSLGTPSTDTGTRVVRRDRCRLCTGRSLEKVVNLQPIPLAEKYTASARPGEGAERYPIDLYMCLDCGHVQQLDVIDSKTLWSDYTYHSGQTQGILDHFEEVAAGLVAKHKPAPGSLVIDVGSNDGSLLRCFKRRGYRVLGVDPAREIARKATESGVETIPELFTPELAKKIREKHGPASVVTAFNVFAHTDDMIGMGKGVRQLLADDGVFQFEAQYLLDIVDKLLLGTIFHEHMSHHSLKPMKRFLESLDMRLIDVQRVTIQMGSIIGTAQPAGGPRPVDPSVGALLALEEERRLDRPETVRQFERRLGELKRKVDGLVAEWKRAGAKVAGYGAARSGPTLIVQFGLGDVIEYVLDDHPQKVHKYSAGHGHLVVPTKELTQRMPDYVVILAWIHAKKIIAANREYLERGGRFVICCPEVQVIDAATPGFK
jgi:SAM-dependent methyltransferase